MNAIAPAPAAAHKVDLSRGQSRMDLNTQWVSRSPDQRFLSLDDLRRSVHSRAERSNEVRIDTRKVEFFAPEIKETRDLSRLDIGLPSGDVVTPTHWSFGQMASLAQAPAGYLRKLPSPIVADALTYGIRYNRANELVKLYNSGPEMLAATGPDYGRIFDHEVVEAVQQIAGNGLGEMRWKVPGVLDWRTHTYDPNHPVTIDTTTLFASDRDVFIFLVDDLHPIEIGKLADGSPDLVFRGFYITNSEVGSSALKVAVFYLRAVCCNRIMWGVEGFEEISMRHSKYAPSRFIEEIRPALASFSEGSVTKLVEGVEMAKAAKVAADQDEAIEFLTARSFSRKSALAILEQHETEEGRPARSAWDLAQGITAFARSIPNNDDRVATELEARRILDKVA